MVFDRNPKFGEDQSFSEGARRIADFLWDTTGGDVSQFPQSYLENLRYEYSDGKVSMLDLIDRVDLGPDATYEEYCEVVDLLIYTDPTQFPDRDSIVEIQPGHLQFEIEDPELDFAEEIIEEETMMEEPTGQQADPLSEKMELFLKKIIASVYRDGVTDVTDVQGNPPTAANNYLLSDDGKSFSGIFYDSPPGEQSKKYPFQIIEKGPDQWQIKY